MTKETKKEKTEKKDIKKGIKELLFGKGWTIGNWGDLKAGTRTGIDTAKKPVKWAEKKGQSLSVEDRELRIRKFRKRTIIVAVLALSAWTALVLTINFGTIIIGIGSFFLPLTIYMQYRMTVKSVRGEMFKKKEKKSKDKDK